MSDERPKELGPVLWFALGAAVLTLVLRVSGLGVIAFATAVLALYWGITGFVRLRRIHQWVRQRQVSGGMR